MFLESFWLNFDFSWLVKIFLEFLNFLIGEVHETVV